MYQTIFHYLLCLRDKNRNETKRNDTIRYDTIRCDTIRCDTTIRYGEESPISNRSILFLNDISKHFDRQFIVLRDDQIKM